MTLATTYASRLGIRIESSRFERMPLVVFEDAERLTQAVAGYIAALIRSKQRAGQNAVLALPIGSTPVGVYKHLIQMHQEGLDFSNVMTFNVDEFYPIDPDALQSYNRFMREHLYDHVNIPKANIHAFDSQIAWDEIEAHCQAYEQAIQDAGGVDLVLLGIGRSGHIGFNEPGSSRATRSRLVKLDQITRKDAASVFFSEDNVPRYAITMGVGTILEAREILLITSGEHKASVVRRAVEEEPNDTISAGFLQFHPEATVFVDRAAAGDLTARRKPWLVGEVEWTDELEKQAVIWLSQEENRPILLLETADFHAHRLHDLAYKYDMIDDLLGRVFEDLRSRIKYQRDLPKSESVILFSPHPDDDVISMGGMLDKLTRNENDIKVAYMVNGSVAVFDEAVERHLDFMSMTAELVEPQLARQVAPRFEEIYSFLSSKKPGEIDTEEVQKIKAFIRYTEAISGLKAMGLNGSNARFLDLPFYRTGRVKKDPIGEADIQIVLDLLRELKPHHIFVAGDLADPHGTHRMCYDAIRHAVDRLVKEDAAVEDFVRPLVWLYRGAWQEWEIHQADVFMPMSKADMQRKIAAIHRHESQKDRVAFPGAYDSREFWERARDRNTSTAKALDALGLPAFHAAEAFVVVYDMPE